jgi:aminoglycoside 6'-N-acetyltransferase
MSQRAVAAPLVWAYHRCVVELRSMTIDDVALLVRWDDDPDVAAALGGRGADWYDWPTELVRDVPWREFLIAEEDGRPIGFVQLIDACEEESHYWGDIEPGTWALDIWIGSAGDRRRGLGSEVMKLAVRRAFDQHAAETVVIDPAVDNHRAISFYEKLGFERVGVREFGDDECLVMRLLRSSTGHGHHEGATR